MTLHEFLKSNKITIPTFASACEVNKNTMKCYVYGSRKPPLETLYRIIVQSGYHVTLEDFIDGPITWKPLPKLATFGKITVGGLDRTTMRKHERKKYFDDIENI